MCLRLDRFATTPNQQLPRHYNSAKCYTGGSTLYCSPSIDNCENLSLHLSNCNMVKAQIDIGTTFRATGTQNKSAQNFLDELVEKIQRYHVQRANLTTEAPDVKLPEEAKETNDKINMLGILLDIVNEQQRQLTLSKRCKDFRRV
jgi:hypothetical protein